MQTEELCTLREATSQACSDATYSYGAKDEWARMSTAPQWLHPVSNIVFVSYALLDMGIEV